jgi:hypothetical protein
MSERRDTFMDKCLRGEATVDAIDEFADEWHSSAGDASIEAFLGITKAGVRSVGPGPRRLSPHRQSLP